MLVKWLKVIIFLYCSFNCKAWAQNEEMVDWFAIQSPKIFRAFREAGVDDFEEVSNVVADCD